MSGEFLAAAGRTQQWPDRRLRSRLALYPPIKLTLSPVALFEMFEDEAPEPTRPSALANAGAG